MLPKDFTDQQICPEIFRRQARKDLSLDNKFLAGWLEGWVERNELSADSRKPWSVKGREFISFHETLYHALYWYQQFKSYKFKPFGFQIDQNVIINIRNKFEKVITHALNGNREGSYNEYLEKYDLSPLSIYTAIDYKFQNITGAGIHNILDFGSGIGRQAFQWCCNGSTNFYSIDVIESLYLLQNKIYQILFPDKIIEYFLDPENFSKLDFSNETNKLFHLPTWKIEILPDNYFDMIICVQVLQEISGRTLMYLLDEFRRIIKKNGFLYIRDNEFWTPVHRIRIGRELLKQGWELVYRYPGQEGADICGIPRLWIFTNADNNKRFRYRSRIKREFLPSHPFSYGSWKDFGLPI